MGLHDSWIPSPCWVMILPGERIPNTSRERRAAAGREGPRSAWLWSSLPWPCSAFRSQGTPSPTGLRTIGLVLTRARADYYLVGTYRAKSWTPVCIAVPWLGWPPPPGSLCGPSCSAGCLREQATPAPAARRVAPARGPRWTRTVARRKPNDWRKSTSYTGDKVES